MYVFNIGKHYPVIFVTQNLNAELHSNSTVVPFSTGTFPLLQNDKNCNDKMYSDEHLFWLELCVNNYYSMCVCQLSIHYQNWSALNEVLRSNSRTVLERGSPNIQFCCVWLHMESEQYIITTMYTLIYIAREGILFLRLSLCM